MQHNHWGFGLLGKGLFACAAVVLMLGGEQDASARQAPAMTAPSQQQMLDARPAPLPSVRASADMQQGGAGATQRWTF